MLISKKKILFMMSGSIATYKASYLISKLVQNNFEVQVVATSSALKFVGVPTLEGLSNKEVISESFAEGHAMSHIHLIRESDLILLCPATANTINKMSQGVGDDLVTTLFLAHDFKKPFLLAPAMNTTMYLHPVTQSSLNHLKKLGVNILETASGVLACGEKGWGKLLDPDLIFSEIVKELNVDEAPSIQPQRIKLRNSSLRVLVTSGGTAEEIDAVRVITNKSTGKTGSFLAEFLYDLGCEVVFVGSKNSFKPQREIEKIFFQTHDELEREILGQVEKNHFDVVVHAAAVGDFVLDSQDAKSSKLSSNASLTLKFKPTTKIINKIKSASKNKKLALVGFKLTAGLSESEIASKVERLISASNADLVISNDVTEFKWDSDIQNKHKFSLWTQKGQVSAVAENRVEFASMLADWIIRKEENKI